MLYRMFLYSSSAATGTAPAVHYANLAVSTNEERQWKGNQAAQFMRPFDTAYIVQCIEKEFTDPATGSCKCRPTVKYPPEQYDQVGFIYVATSYAKAAQVLPRLHAIAAENDLVLYDAETGRSYFKDLVDRTYITMRTRQQALHNAILQDMKPVRNIRRLEFISEGRDKACSYVVTIRKDPRMPFAERNVKFYECLQKNLQKDEALVCEAGSYRIVGEYYTITYILEGYKKHPDKIGFTQWGMTCVAPLNRMGVEEAYRWMKNCTEREKEDILARMRFREMQYRYPNPADRFVESVKITKWQRKQVFDVRYSGYGYYGSEILFHVVPHSRSDDVREISVLKLEEDCASFILPFIDEIYPDFYERYYLDENHLSAQMWLRILDRLRKAKQMILQDTFNPELAPYIRRFDLYVFAPREAGRITDDTQFLYEHRYQVGKLFDVFIQWSEAQLRAHGDRSDLMFNIQGP